MNDLRQGLKLPVVTLPGVWHMPAAGEDEKQALRAFYVAAMRASHKLLITARGNEKCFEQLKVSGNVG